MTLFTLSLNILASVMLVSLAFYTNLRLLKHLLLVGSVLLAAATTYVFIYQKISTYFMVELSDIPIYSVFSSALVLYLTLSLIKWLAESADDDDIETFAGILKELIIVLVLVAALTFVGAAFLPHLKTAHFVGPALLVTFVIFLLAGGWAKPLKALLSPWTLSSFGLSAVLAGVAYL